MRNYGYCYVVNRKRESILVIIHENTMQKKLKIGKFEITQLHGGDFVMDAGAIFGVVPKVLWQKKYTADAENSFLLKSNVLLVKWDTGALLIESGLGNKLTEKQRKIFKVHSEWRITQDLLQLGLEPNDIKYVILTHCDFDHAGGIIQYDAAGEPKVTFPEAYHVVQEKEWYDANHPNIRSTNTYWSHNFAALHEENLFLVSGDHEIIPGVRVIHTSGHTRGHQAVVIESEGEVAIHLGDLMPTHLHNNPLWVMAYDNFPLDSIEMKKKLIDAYCEKEAWFTFYHDTAYLACKLDEDGEVIDTV